MSCELAIGSLVWLLCSELILNWIRFHTRRKGVGASLLPVVSLEVAHKWSLLNWHRATEAAAAIFSLTGNSLTTAVELGDKLGDHSARGELSVYPQSSRRSRSTRGW